MYSHPQVLKQVVYTRNRVKEFLGTVAVRLELIGASPSITMMGERREKSEKKDEKLILIIGTVYPTRLSGDNSENRKENEEDGSIERSVNTHGWRSPMNEF